MQMPYAGFMSFAKGVREVRNRPLANAPKDIILYDVQDQTANARLTAWWGIDYLLLAKQNGRWLITHEHISMPIDMQARQAVTDLQN